MRVLCNNQSEVPGFSFSALIRSALRLRSALRPGAKVTVAGRVEAKPAAVACLSNWRRSICDESDNGKSDIGIFLRYAPGDWSLTLLDDRFNSFMLFRLS